MRMLPALFVTLFTALGASASLAAQLQVQPVAPQVYALVGPHEQRNADNLANNATFGLLVTDEGCLLVDPGGSWQGAAALEQAIAGISDCQVKLVINTGGQDHRWLGNGYWQAKGAQVVASEAAVADHQERGSLQLSALSQLLGDDALAGTQASYADQTFEADQTLTLGGTEVQILHRGQAHTPGDSFVWLPQQRVMFTGDIVYTERLLGVGGQSHASSWIAVFEAMAAFEPLHIVPGHGAPTDLARATAETLDYLKHLRQTMGAYIDEGGDMQGSTQIDQSAFAHLEQFEALAGRNAQQVFSEMEWE